MASPDSDIQFLGNWGSHPPNSSSKFVSAIVLKPIEPVTPDMEPSMMFSRDQTPVVHVGRNTSETTAIPVDKAVFTSPVVSRSHAKITFADSGPVFIIDTGSYHGTWVARAGERNELTPKTPFQLQDGDKVTFGKDVTKDGERHHPVTVTVKLLHADPSPSPMSMSTGSLPPEVTHSPPARPRNTFGIQPSTEEEVSSESDSPEYSDDDNNYRKPSESPVSLEPRSPSPGREPSEMMYSSSSSSTGGSSSSSEADADQEPPSEEPRTEFPPSMIHPVFPPPWRNLPSISSHLLNRFGFPRSPRSAVGRFDVLFGSRSPRVEEILMPEPSITHSAHEDFEGLGFHGAQVRHGHHHHHHTGPHDPHCLHHGQTHHGHTDHVSSPASEEDIVKLTERIDALVKEIDALKESNTDISMVKSFPYDPSLDHLTSKQAQLRNATNAVDEKLKLSIDALETEISTLKAQKNTLQTDIRFLRADSDARGKEIEALRSTSENRISEMNEQVVALRASVEEAQLHSMSLKMAVGSLSANWEATSDDVKSVFEKVSRLQAEMEKILALRSKTESDLNAFRAENDIALERLVMQIKTEMADRFKEMIEESRNTAVLGKRKRDDDDVGSSEDDIDSNDSITSTSSPRKRARLVSKIITAGAVGAIGAWIGLAYL